jgi:hypothetical protein
VHGLHDEVQRILKPIGEWLATVRQRFIRDLLQKARVTLIALLILTPILLEHFRDGARRRVQFKEKASDIFRVRWLLIAPPLPYSWNNTPEYGELVNDLREIEAVAHAAR